MEQLDFHKILVIDDEQSLRDGAQRILSRMNHEVFLAPKGDAGLAVLKDTNIGIVLLDMKMPGMDGMEVLKRIMEMNRGIIVIVITGYATVETAIEAMKQGAYDFIPKPYAPDQLRIVVNRAVETLTLKREAEKLEREQRRTLADLHTEKSRTHTIIESLPNGVLVTNTKGKVVLINPACCQHLDLEPETKPGDDIAKYIQNPELCRLVTDISRGRYIDYNDIPSHELSVKNEKYFLVRCRPVLGDKNQCLGTVVNIMDISTMKILDQFKSEFVAKVSHELRSPLSTIHEQLGMVMGSLKEETDHEDQHMLSRAKEKTRGLISTIGDLLDLSRVEAGISVKESKPVNLDKLLQNIGDFLSASASAKKQTLTVTVPDKPLPPLIADPMALESVFGNLISNAINYTPENGRIEVLVELAGKNLRVMIRDNGFGIEARHMDKIFERFYRVKNDKTRFLTGTGLGLPIVKGIVDSLNGYIDVESEVNKGSTFTVILPLKKEHL